MLSMRRRWSSIGVVLVVLLSLHLATAYHTEDHDYGSTGTDERNGVGNREGPHINSSLYGWAGLGPGVRPPPTGACPSLPEVCGEDELPQYDDESCVTCLPTGAEINGCSLDQLADCADEWDDLRFCNTSEVPERSNITCCYSCRVDTSDWEECTDQQVAACKEAWLGTNEETALPLCANGTTSEYNETSCCRNCREPYEPYVPFGCNVTSEGNVTDSDDNVNVTDTACSNLTDACTWEEFEHCLEYRPICATGEAVFFDNSSCCGSCIRPWRTCDLASVARCNSVLPSCDDDEIPIWIEGECCPTCFAYPPTVCGCDEEQICVIFDDAGDTNDTETGVELLVNGTCLDRADIAFTITPQGNLTALFELLNADEIRHLIGEYIRRTCDKSDYADDCEKYHDILEAIVISTTIECWVEVVTVENITINGTDYEVTFSYYNGTIRTHGGDRRINGLWGASVDGDVDKNWDASITADPDRCNVSVFISIGIPPLDEESSSSSSSSSSSTGTGEDDSSSTGLPDPIFPSQSSTGLQDPIFPSTGGDGGGGGGGNGNGNANGPLRRLLASAGLMPLSGKFEARRADTMVKPMVQPVATMKQVTQSVKAVTTTGDDSTLDNSTFIFIVSALTEDYEIIADGLKAELSVIVNDTIISIDSSSTGDNLPDSSSGRDDDGRSTGGDLLKASSSGNDVVIRDTSAAYTNAVINSLVPFVMVIVAAFSALME